MICNLVSVTCFEPRKKMVYSFFFFSVFFFGTRASQ